MIRRKRRERRNILERTALLPEINIVEVRHQSSIRTDVHDLVRVGKGQAVYQNGIHKRKDRAVDANPQCKRDNSNQREFRVFCQHPQSEPYVLD